MTKPDSKSVRIFEAKTAALLNGLQRLYNQGKLNAAAGLLADETTLVLLKSQKIYQGKTQIYAFLKELRKQGIREIKMTVQKKRLRPVEELTAGDSSGSFYWAYDLEALLLGKYEFKNPTKAFLSGKSLFILRHRKDCIPIAPFFLLDF